MRQAAAIAAATLRPSALADGRAPRTPPPAALSQRCTKHKEIESRGGRRRGASQADLRSKAAASSSGGVRIESAKVQIRRHGGFCYPRDSQNRSKTPPSAHTSPPHARRAAFGFAECGRRRLSPPPFAPVRFRGRARAAQLSPAAFKQHLIKHKEIESRGGRRRGASRADLRSKAAASSSGGVRTEPAKVQIRRHGGFC